MKEKWTIYSWCRILKSPLKVSVVEDEVGFIENGKLPLPPPTTIIHCFLHTTHAEGRRMGMCHVKQVNVQRYFLCLKTICCTHLFHMTREITTLKGRGCMLLGKGSIIKVSTWAWVLMPRLGEGMWEQGTTKTGCSYPTKFWPNIQSAQEIMCLCKTVLTPQCHLVRWLDQEKWCCHPTVQHREDSFANT